MPSKIRYGGLVSMNILNGTKAFEAMSAGQKIECRHVGSDLDFDEIRNFPATVFIDQEYEFRVAVVYMLIGAIRVPEATKEAPAKGTLCFTPSLLTTELSKSFKWKNSDLDLALLQRGQVHLYEENAFTHAQALIAVSLGQVNKPLKNEVDLPWDVEEKTLSSQSNIEITEQGPITATEENLTDFGLTNAEPVAETLSVDELKHLQEEAEKLVADKKLADKTESDYNDLLNDLITRAENAIFPKEATSLTSYTKGWTEQQRKPLLNAIHKRLQELAPAETIIELPPSLIVQIQNAKDLTELDCLEIEVSTRHIDIQPKLMGYVKQRRFELENQASEAS